MHWTWFFSSQDIRSSVVSCRRQGLGLIPDCSSGQQWVGRTPNGYLNLHSSHVQRRQETDYRTLICSIKLSVFLVNGSRLWEWLATDNWACCSLLTYLSPLVSKTLWNYAYYLSQITYWKPGLRVAGTLGCPSLVICRIITQVPSAGNKLNYHCTHKLPHPQKILLEVKVWTFKIYSYCINKTQSWTALSVSRWFNK